MTAQTALQYWKFHTPEQLVRIEERTVRGKTFQTKKPYIVCFEEALSRRYQDAQDAIQEYERIKAQVLTEVLCISISEGLELTLKTDDNDAVSENQLLGLVTPTTRKSYKHAKQTAERLCQVYSLLQERYAWL